MQNITKLSEAKFHIVWDEKSEDDLTVNFNPLISTYRLKGEFCMVHWQAKPKFLRRWGIYDSSTDSYRAFDHDKLDILIGVQCRPLQINEGMHSTVPTAVLLFEPSILVVKTNGSYVIKLPSINR